MILFSRVELVPRISSHPCRVKGRLDQQAQNEFKDSTKLPTAESRMGLISRLEIVSAATYSLRIKHKLCQQIETILGTMMTQFSAKALSGLS